MGLENRNQARMTKRYFVDAFAGCGGFSLGLAKAGWNLAFAIEAHRAAFATYERNILAHLGQAKGWHPDIPVSAWSIEDFSKENAEAIDGMAGKIDLMVGGPPCQGFSTNGRRDPSDPRNSLVEAYLKLVERLEPRLVVLENVRGFTSMAHGDGETFAGYVATRLQSAGYDTWGEMLNSADWGVPQARHRFFLIAAKRGSLPGVDPFSRLKVARRRFLQERGLDPATHVTTSGAIEDLRTDRCGIRPDPDFGDKGFFATRYRSRNARSAYAKLMRDGARRAPSDCRLPNHTPAVARRFAEILATCQRGRTLSQADRERIGVKKRTTTPMCPDKPAPTVTTLPDDTIHYAEPRTLTVRENARIQSFPDWFAFEGPYTAGGPGRKASCPRYTQVGNAVPPLLAEALGELLVSLLSDQELECDASTRSRRDVRRAAA